jgi:hypothetical protein
MAFEQCKTRTEKSLTICYDSAKVSAEIEDPVTGGRHYGQQLDSACLLPIIRALGLWPLDSLSLLAAAASCFMLGAGAGAPTCPAENRGTLSHIPPPAAGTRGGPCGRSPDRGPIAAPSGAQPDRGE